MSRDQRAARRAIVRQLADRGMSARAIAAELGVGKDTVRRDLEALAHDTNPAQTTAAPPAGAAEQPGIFIPLTGAVHRALGALAHAGLTDPAAATEWALRLAAAACRQAHTAGYPPGTPPTITAVEFANYSPEPGHA